MTWGCLGGKNAKSSGGGPLPACGRPLGRLNIEDFKAVIDKGLLQYGEL